MKKKLLSIILVAMLSLNAIPCTAFAADGGTSTTTTTTTAVKTTVTSTAVQTTAPTTEPTTEATTVTTTAPPKVKEKLDLAEKIDKIDLTVQKFGKEYSLISLTFDQEGKTIKLTADLEWDESVSSYAYVSAHLKNIDFANAEDAETYELVNTTNKKTDDDFLTVGVSDKEKIIQKVQIAPKAAEYKMGDAKTNLECKVVTEDNEWIPDDFKFYCDLDTGGKYFPEVKSFGIKSARVDKKTTDGYTFKVEVDPSCKVKIASADFDTSGLGFLPKDLGTIFINESSNTFTVICTDSRYELSLTAYNNDFHESINIPLQPTPAGTQNKATYYIRPKAEPERIKILTLTYGAYEKSILGSAWITTPAPEKGKEPNTSVSGSTYYTCEDSLLKVLLIRKHDDSYDVNSIKLNVNDSDKDIASSCTKDQGIKIAPMVSTTAAVTEDDTVTTTTAAAPETEFKNGVFNMVGNDGNDYYYAEFKLDAEDNKMAEYGKFRLKVVNTTNDAEYVPGDDKTFELGTAYGDDKELKKVVVDKADPVIVSSKDKDGFDISFENSNSLIRSKFKVKDDDSGIRKVEYAWNFQKKDEEEAAQDKDADDEIDKYKITTYSKFDSTPGQAFELDITTPYSEIPDEMMKDDSYTLYVRITDNAGNTKIYSKEVESRLDSKEPKFLFSCFIDKNGELSDESVAHYAFGNYTNKDLKMVLIFKDETDGAYLSGINSITANNLSTDRYAVNDETELGKSIALLDSGKKDADYVRDAIKHNPLNKSALENMGKSDGKGYVMVVYDAKSISSDKELVFQCSDGENNISSKKFNEVVDGADSSRFMLDKSKPKVDFSFTDIYGESVNIGTDPYKPTLHANRVWLNGEDKWINLDFDDQKGSIQSIKIVMRSKDRNGNEKTETYLYPCKSEDGQRLTLDKELNNLTISVPLHSDEPEAATKLPEDEDINKLRTTGLTDWKYYFNFEITDAAGNVTSFDTTPYQEPLKVGICKVDGDKPETNLNVEQKTVDGISMMIGDQLWVKKVISGNKLVFEVSNNYAGLGSDVTVNINGKNVEFTPVGNADDDESDNSGKTTITVPLDKVAYNKDHKYVVKITGHDNARNQIDLDAVAYIDTKEPVIKSITATKGQSAVTQTLNFLGLGVFSNDVVKLSVDVEESPYDSGIDTVKLSYNLTDGKSTETVACEYNEETGRYETILPLSDAYVFFNNISVTAVDKCGNVSQESEFTIRDSKGDDYPNCVVIENNPPVIGIAFPENDMGNYTEPEESEDQPADQPKDQDDTPEEEQGQKDDKAQAEDETEKEANIYNSLAHRASSNADIEKLTPENNIWYAENRHIVVMVQDIQSGLGEISFKLNGIDLKETGLFKRLEDKDEPRRIDNDTHYYGFDTDEFKNIYVQRGEKQPEDCKYVFEVFATDNSGNETETLKFTYFLDDSRPVIKNFIFDPATKDDESEAREEGVIKVEENFDYQYFFDNRFWAVFKVEDPHPSSEFDKVLYTLLPYENGVPMGENAVNGELHVYTDIEELEEGSVERALYQSILDRENQAEEQEEMLPPWERQARPEEIAEKDVTTGYAWIEIPINFKGRIYVNVFDKIGHSSHERTTSGYVTDNTAPSVEITGTGNTRFRDEDDNKLYSDDVNIDVVISDSLSGIRSFKYEVTSDDGDQVMESDEIELSNYSELGEGDRIDDKWEISRKENNIVTEIRRTITFDSDNNNIQVKVYEVTDNSRNINKGAESEVFTVDKTRPVIDVSINDGVDGSNYYTPQNPPVITVKITERNYDRELIRASVESTYGHSQPTVEYRDPSSTEHYIIYTFGEGDFTFDVRGTDRAGQSAEVNMDRTKIRSFSIDGTAPVVENNFGDFADEKTGNYLSSAKNIEITVVEHNFDPERSGLRIWHKDPGSDHDNTGFTDITDSVVSRADWESDNDTHKLSAKLKQDGVYKIEVAPSDPSGNSAKSSSSGIFELDTTKPEIMEKNGKKVDNSNAEKFLDIYPSSRKNDAKPSVEFKDANFDHLKYVLTVYAPQYKNGKELTLIQPELMYLPSDKDKTGTVNSTRFELPQFDRDGVYALEVIAVDKAGNESRLNSNTYMRLVDTDVLAYIPNSSIERKTGLYSFQYENGEPISKRPDNFSSFDIVVFSKEDSDVKVVLRDYNGDEKPTNLRSADDDSLYGVNISRFTLNSDYFRSNFQEDTDSELYLSVKNDNSRIDLGRLHIDNIEPSCTLPKDFKSWKWLAGNKSRTFTMSNIDEQLDIENCKVYDNGREIPFEYSPENKSLSFSLDKGWHSVGVKLEDEAGNVYSIQEIDNLYIGYFWLWIILAAIALLAGAAAFIIYRVRKKKLY